MPKTGDNKTIDARRIMAMPIIFIPNPTLIKSMILTFPLENIIALGGVARNKSYFRVHMETRLTNGQHK